MPRQAKTLLLAVAAGVLALRLPAALALAETTVPIDLQADLLRKVARFERTLAGRARDRVLVLIAVYPHDVRSERAAAQLRLALTGTPELIGKPLQVDSRTFTSVSDLKATIAREGPQLVYLTPGFEPEVAGIAEALRGVPVLTVTTDGDQVDRGVVLGFELFAARPRIVINVGQAQKQGLDFNSDLFRLARVVK